MPTAILNTHSLAFQDLTTLLRPEILLAAVACVLFLFGVSSRVAVRKAAPMVAALALIGVFLLQLTEPATRGFAADSGNTLHLSSFSAYVKLIAAGVGLMFVLLSWPSNADGTGNTALNFGQESGEYFALLLLSLTGIFLVATANDIILLFLGIELASIPTYIMVSISRPIAVSQEAGVKYFFLGAMAAAVMLFGFSYLYGTTGSIHLDEIGRALRSRAPGGAAAAALSPWQLLAVVMLICGLAFKIAAVPLHFYAGDVYEGAATPVTALLSFVPKTAGFVALIKILAVLSGPAWAPLPPQIVKLLGILAVLTMSFGNALAVFQRHNLKRVLAYSSVAHSGYMLVGLTALAAPAGAPHTSDGVQAILFYLAAYGIMNTAAFAVLMLLPARVAQPATSAETYDDIAGQGRLHPGLGLCMAVSCFSLIGIPLTVGFLGKLLLFRAAWNGGFDWLVIVMAVNAAASAAYYLQIVKTMFLRPAPPKPEDYGFAPLSPALSASPAVGATAAITSAPESRPNTRVHYPFPIVAALCLSVGGTLFFGAIVPATQMLVDSTHRAMQDFDTSGSPAPKALTPTSLAPTPPTTPAVISAPPSIPAAASNAAAASYTAPSIPAPSLAAGN